LFTLPVQAQESRLAVLIPQGKWALAYQRIGELRPLHLRHTEEGTSYTCIDQDPRVKILNWIQSKGCTVHEENMDGDIFRMRGECVLRFWKSSSVPVRVSLTPVNKNTFLIDIQTEGNSILGYTEHTKGSYVGDCDEVKPASAPLEKKEQNERG
jgi:hypothetical protein